jgi:Na+(H+)/acetate symporter ActP
VTVAGDPRRLALMVAVVVLLAATVFGLWHMVVGGLVHGNLRAGAFGVILASAAGTVLVAALAVLRRRRPG